MVKRKKLMPCYFIEVRNRNGEWILDKEIAKAYGSFFQDLRSALNLLPTIGFYFGLHLDDLRVSRGFREVRSK